MSGLTYFFRDHLENAPDADDEDDAAAAASTYQQSIAPLQQQQPGDDDDHSVALQDYKEYVKEKRQELLTFLNERMVGSNSDDGEDGQANEEKQQQQAQSDEDDEDDQEEGPETQQPDQLLLNQPDDNDDDDNSSRFAGVVPATKFPHISETSQTVSNISEIDLYCNKIQLNLCTVDKVWDFRNTKRNKKHPAKEKQYRSFLSDGPLNIIYNNVYSMEIRQ